MNGQPKCKEDVLRIVKDRNIEFIYFQYTEMYGKPCAKIVPAWALEMIWESGAGAAGFAAGEIGQGPHDPDIEAFPDPTTFVQLPWQPELGLLVCDVYVRGEPWPYDPRLILRNMVEYARQKGYVFNVGVEPEFMLLEADPDVTNPRFADPYDTMQRPCYDVKGITRQYPYVRELSHALNELGWSNYALDHEDGNGQFEANIMYDQALNTADKFVTYKYMVDTIARKHGMMATFMPKPFVDQTGNGLHMTFSLWDEKNERNLFEDLEDPRGMGLSKLGYNFIGGLLHHAQAYIGISAPTVNSYKRLRRGTLERRTWVPVNVTYGGNNRTQMLRVGGPGRVEDRTPDASGSPYLTMAAILRCGLDGIERELDPGEPNHDNLYDIPEEEIRQRGIDFLPGNLSEAIDNLQQDETLRQAFGQANGEYFLDYYCRVKKREWDSYHQEISPWELKNQLLFP
ncbi:type III glutamate--ammonia ligase [Methylonatrum kenyense]|uniref:type III glutamate--ammonia ligase n=1 Tax=Methylonatrum kenyense TaxID=455253 RepID=UPI0020BE74FD|nr:type III glutamate--ammonia ligase [Methylonatrum kenyense]MCK8516333.1 type III glutamate--ammonia ligase [Methylonatrum kenyense]